MSTTTIVLAGSQSCIEVRAATLTIPPLRYERPTVGWLTVWRNDVAVRVSLTDVEAERLFAALSALPGVKL